MHSEGPLTITGSQIMGNRSEEDCGAVDVLGNSLTIQNSTFGGNTAGSAGEPRFGGAICVHEGDLIPESSVIGGSSPNQTYGGYGAVHAVGGSIGHQFTLRNTQITNNVSQGLSIHGNNTGITTLDQVQISGNQATGLHLVNAGVVELLNNTLISGNQNTLGGDILSHSSEVHLSDGTHITGNLATSTDIAGGGIYNTTNAVLVVGPGVQIDHNQATKYGGGILNYGGLTLDHTVLSDNIALYGGRVYSSSLRTVAIHTTCITGNSPDAVSAVRNYPYYPMLDASNNWWGAADGPSGAGPGSGDSV